MPIFVPVCVFHSGLAQSHTPLNTAVFMAYCNSGEEQIGQREIWKKKKESWRKELKPFNTELMKIQKHKWLRGKAERTKEAIHSVQYYTPWLSQPSRVFHNSFSFSSPSNIISPFTVWLVKAVVAVGTEFKKAAWEFLCPGGTARHGPPAEQQQSPPPEPGQWWIWTARKHTG